jgi:ABC-2 type transport system permease protein
MKAIYTLWLRQVIKYFRSKSRIIGSLAQPLLFLVAFGFGFGSIYERAGEGNYIQYLAPGIITMSMVMTALFSGIDIIWDRKFGFLKETMVAPVPRWQIFLGKILGGSTVAMIQGLIVFGLTLIVGFKPINWLMIPLALLFAFLIALLFTAMGTMIAAKLEDMQGFQLIMNFLVMPIVFLSGAFFPLGNLPKGIEFITKIDPLTYGVDGLRGALIGVNNFSFLTDMGILIIVSIVLLILGTRFFEKIKV